MMDDIADIMDRVPGLTQGTAILLLALWNGRPRIQTHERLAEAMFDATGQRGTNEAIRTGIKRLRRLRVPVEIEAARGVGYRLLPLPKRR